jgi:hypothetical protein
MNISILSVPNVVRQILAAMAVLALVFSPFASVQFAQAHHDPYGGVELKKVVVCHWDASDAYKSSGDLAIEAAINGHDGHDFDIIAPFHYKKGNDSLTYPGKNWDGWDNGAPIPALEGENPQDIWSECVGMSLKGTIVVDKVTVPANDPQSFSFTTTGSGYTGFSLTHAATPNSQELNAGTYSVSETPVNGWTQTSVACVSSLGGSENPASIGLVIGETVTCTFTNTKDAIPPVLGCTDPEALNHDPEATEDDGSCEYPESAKLTIVKEVEAADGASLPGTWSFDFDHAEGTEFTLDDENTSKEFSGAIVGEHNFTEVTPLPADWYLTGVVCEGLLENQWSVDSETDELTVTLADEDEATCTFTNTYRPTVDPDLGSISGTKYNWDTEDGLSGWTIFIDENDNQALDDGEKSVVTDENGDYTFINLDDGTYDVCEVMQTGWEQTSPDTANGCHEVTIIEGNAVEDVNFVNRELPEVLSCELSASDTSIRRGQNVVLTWSSNNATYAELDGEEVDLSDSHEFTNLRSNTTYTLVVWDENENSETCTVTVNTRSGGSGSSSTRTNDDEEDEVEPTGTPQVLGDQVSIVPLGAANTGAGGTSPVQIPQIPFASLVGALSLRRNG